LNSPLKSKVLHSMSWVAASQLISQLLRWAATFIVINLLNPSDFAIINFAETVIGFLELFTTLGMSAAIIRSQNLAEEELRSVFSLTLLVAFGLCTLLFFSAPWIAAYYRQDELIWVVRVLSLGFPLTAISMLPSAYLTKEMQFKKISIIQVGASAVGAILSLVLSYLGYGYWALVIGGVGIQAVRAIATLATRPVLPWPSLDLKKALYIANFGGIVLGGNILTYIYMTFDVVIAGRFWNEENIGVYALALQLAVMPLTKIMQVMTQVALPAYAKLQANPQTSRNYLVKSLSLGMGLGLPLFFGMASVASLIVPLFLEPKWAGVAMPLTLLFLTMPFRMFLELHLPAILALGKPGTLFNNGLLMVGIMLPVFFVISVNFDDPAVLAGAWVATFPVLALLSSFNFCKLLEIDFAGLLKKIALPFFMSVLMFAAVRLVIHQMADVLHPIVNLCLAILVGAGLFLGAIATLDKAMFNEYFELVRKR
jgi:teichuronic acid exporter